MTALPYDNPNSSAFVEFKTEVRPDGRARVIMTANLPAREDAEPFTRWVKSKIQQAAPRPTRS